MKTKSAFLAIPLLFSIGQVFADDTTPLLERDQLRLQQRQELQAMTPEERALYREMNQARDGSGTPQAGRKMKQGKGNGQGDRKRLRDGSGNGDGQTRNERREFQRSSEQRSGYGSGFGSRMGGHGRR